MTSDNASNVFWPNYMPGPSKTKRKGKVMMRTAALYARVSTLQQVQEATIDSQIAQLEQYAQQHGYKLKREHYFIDEGVSGQGLHRPALTRLRDVALSGAFTAILCLSPDRLSRNMGIQQLLLAEWAHLQMEVIFSQRPRLAKTPQDELLLNIEGAFAEYERAVICDRMRRGRRHSLRQGRSAPYPAPYGYHFVPATAQQGSHWLENEAQAVVVGQIYGWYTEEQLKIGDIATRLNEQKTPGPSGKGWCYSTVRHILCQPAYTGTAYYGRCQRDYSRVGLPRRSGSGRLQYPRPKERPVEEWIPIIVPALLDETTWQQAQERRAMNAKMAARRSQRNYLLRSLLRCGICQHTLYGRAQSGRLFYYCPAGSKKRDPGVPRHHCTIDAEVIEPLVWEALANLLRQPDLIRDAWETHRHAQTPSALQTTRWQQRQRLLQHQQQRLLDAYQAGVISLDDLTERQNKIVQELQTLETRLAATDIAATTKISLQQFTAQIERALQSTDARTQQNAIRMLIERIIVKDDAVVIEHIIPLTNISRLESTHYHE